VKKNIGEGNKREGRDGKKEKRGKTKNDSKKRNYRECDKGKGQNRE